MTGRISIASGVGLWPGFLDRGAQQELVALVMGLAEQAPFYRATMPRTGYPMSVEMTNFGPLGWYSDAGLGYRYQDLHPVTGRPWPPMPPRLLQIWAETTGYPAPPEACLVNLYRDKAHMALHRDQDEQDFDAPVLSISLGDSAQFRFGASRVRSAATTLIVASGDVLVFGGPARMMFHGIDRIYPGSSDLVPGGGRLNLTLRRVTSHGEKKATDQGGDRSPNALFALNAGRG